MTSIGTLLSDYLRTLEVRPFDWSTNNCGHFVYNWFRFCTSRTLPGAVPAFESKAATRRFVTVHSDLANYITEITGLTPIAPVYAQIGDIVLLQSTEQDRILLGICNGHTNVYLGHCGSPVFEDSAVTYAWRMCRA